MSSPTPDSQPPQDRSLPAAAEDDPRTDDRADDDGCFPVVGIGASAGGLEAFTQLLTHLPPDTGMAVVLVQHLDPSQGSLLSDIIARTTSMPVQAITDGLAVAPNHIYVIPPNALLDIENGRLRLQPRESTQRVNKTIDRFFEALARDRGHNAIGVVLSGGDSDGTLGLEAIKAAGGITFAQSEDSAQVTSMPHMAIATGQVDFVLPPDQIAATLASLSRHPYVSRPIAELPAAVSEADTLSAIFALLKARSRVDFSQYKPTTLKRRILRRMALHHIEQIDRYQQYLQETPAEVQALYQEILISVTSFFRDAGAFDCLKREVFPALLRDRSPELSLRVWTAGCSTGEEAYSIAISLLEFLANQPQRPPIQIFATDISETAIEIARLGVYLPSKVAEVSADRLQRFFVPVEGGYQISKPVRELCVFARQNLISDPPFSRLDLISCRNVLIYFSSALQKKVLPMFHYGLKPRGFLMLGSSETVGEFSDLFTLLDRQYKIYAKQSAALRLNLDLVEVNRDRETPSAIPSYQEPRPTLDIYSAADQVVLGRYGPVGVVVNSQLDILQFRGQTGAYLGPAPGRASLNLLTMAKDSLRLDLRTALYQARQFGQSVRKASLLREGDRVFPVTIEVLPFQPSAEGEIYFLVLFDREDQGQAEEGAIAGSTEESPSPERQNAHRLQQELETTKSHLQSIIEQQEATNQDLRAANEEILSSNEELQSTNEELQTAKEEIQATNEELSTINDELYRRNAETTRISNDFQNLLGSINIPILMLEGDLSIRRFTPTAAALFNLIPTDIGRPLSDINHRLTIDDLEAQILAVITTLIQYSREVQDQDGHWYDLRIRPYRTLDNRIDGAVLVLVDIDGLKRSTEELIQARDYAEAIVEMVRDSLLVLDAALRVVRANGQFYAVFQVTPQETEGRSIFEIGNGQWNIPQLRSLLQDLLPQNTQVENFQVSYVFDHIGPQVMQLNARQIFTTTGSPMILLTIQPEGDRP
ncbi:chemotaxis protein CheB [Nodosilinea nodulosa]|uniref:chemotaxis protein CheB n=1 Tax=Nodosilinea nodulosa TaxID=416001 RepID=UPI0002DA548C|nr:chemotaxis protein CheB [Nodosilinea nodulosa]